MVPDRVIRHGIRRLLESKRQEIHADDIEHAATLTNRFVAMMDSAPIALVPELANEQHYEVPAAFFEQVLGQHRKYSCSHWSADVTNLDDAEADALQQTVERAKIGDGMSILDLGCGWGSLSLWIAEHFPNTTIVSVSNSQSQRDYIAAQAEARGLGNVSVHVCDMNDFEPHRTFDRVVSVEMFEHMRNYELLFQRLSNWLTPEGRAFVHIFCHRHTPYLFETEGAANWMGRHFFTGGTMPSEDLFGHFNDNLSIEHQWRVSGMHYYRTCEAWLQNLDHHRSAILQRFRRDLPAREARKSLQRWRMFFMACGELFRYRSGNEWFVAHYLFKNRATSTLAGQGNEHLQKVG